MRVLMNSHSLPLSAPCLPANASANSQHDERGRQQENMKEDFQGKGSVSHKLYTQPHRFTQTGFGCHPSHLHTHGMGSQASSVKPVCTFPLAYASLRLVETKDTSGGVYLSLGKVTCLGIKLITFSRHYCHENMNFHFPKPRGSM